MTASTDHRSSGALEPRPGRRAAARRAAARSTGAAPTSATRCPDDLSPYAAAVVFGGPQSANDDHLPGVRVELTWLERTALPSDKPLLGICLGAQMIARVLGARVGPHPEGLVEIGYHTIYPTAAGQAYLDGPTHVLPVAQGDLRDPARRGPPRAQRRLRQPGVPLQPARLWPGVPSRDDPRDDRALDQRRSAARRCCRCAAARRASCSSSSYHRHAPVTDRWLDWFLEEHLLRDRAA